MNANNAMTALGTRGVVTTVESEDTIKICVSNGMKSVCLEGSNLDKITIELESITRGMTAKKLKNNKKEKDEKSKKDDSETD